MSTANEQKHTADCGSCKFWESRGVLPGSENHEQHGACKRHAPILIMVGAMTQTRFPFTSELDWCGDWENGVGM